MDSRNAGKAMIKHPGRKWEQRMHQALCAYVNSFKSFKNSKLLCYFNCFRVEKVEGGVRITDYFYKEHIRLYELPKQHVNENYDTLASLKLNVKMLKNINK